MLLFFLPEHVKEVFATQASKLKCEVFFFKLWNKQDFKFHSVAAVIKNVPS